VLGNVHVLRFRPNNDRIQRCRELCSILDAVFNDVQSLIRPGSTTAELDRVAEESIVAAGCFPLFKINPRNDYPAAITASVNDQVVNTIPSTRALLSNDLLSLQIGIARKGAFACQAWTFVVESITPEDNRLWQAGIDALNNAIPTIRAGSKVRGISSAIQSTLESAGFAPGREFVGHGIGDEPHVEPAIPCYVGRSVSQARILEQTLVEGQILSIDVFAHAGSHRTKRESDQWSVATRDGSNAVHFSHVLAVASGGCEVLTSDRS
jgi:methionyl aminopeptidase